MSDPEPKSRGYHFPIEKLEQGAAPIRLLRSAPREAAIRLVREVDAKLVATYKARLGEADIGDGMSSSDSIRRGLLYLATLCPEELIPCWQRHGSDGQAFTFTDMKKRVEAFVGEEANLDLIRQMGLREPATSKYYAKYFEMLARREPSGRRESSPGGDGRTGPVGLLALCDLYPFVEEQVGQLGPILEPFDRFVHDAAGKDAEQLEAERAAYADRLDDLSFAVLSSVDQHLEVWLKHHERDPRNAALRKWAREADYQPEPGNVRQLRWWTHARNQLREQVAFCLYYVSGYTRDDPNSVRLEADLDCAITETRRKLYSATGAPTQAAEVDPPPLCTLVALLRHTRLHVDRVQEKWQMVAEDNEILPFLARGDSLTYNLGYFADALSRLPGAVRHWHLVHRSVRTIHRPIA